MQSAVDASGRRVCFNCKSPNHMLRKCPAGEIRGKPYEVQTPGNFQAVTVILQPSSQEHQTTEGVTEGLAEHL